jgi:hypothetical protein
MPLLILYGVPFTRSDCVAFLLVTLLNRKPASVREVTVTIDLPTQFMPDDLIGVHSPEGMTVSRHVRKSIGEGQVRYEISHVRPHDCILIPEPIVLRSSEFAKEKGSQEWTRMLDVRLILQTSRTLREERFRMIGVRCKATEELLSAVKSLTDVVMESLPTRSVFRRAWNDAGRFDRLVGYSKKLETTFEPPRHQEHQEE